MRELQIIHCELAEAPHLTHIKTTLHSLHLKGNNISKIPFNYFEGCNHLREVHLTENELIAVPYLGFICRTLHILDLIANKIQNVSWLYDPLPALDAVRLDNNLIFAICIQPLSIWPSLSDMHLRYNKLTRFHLPSGDGRIFNLYGNPFHCDERLGWTHRCHRSGDGFRCGNLYFDYVFGMRCASPSQWHGFSPLDAGNSLVFLLFCRQTLGTPELFL